MKDVVVSFVLHIYSFFNTDLCEHPLRSSIRRKLTQVVAGVAAEDFLGHAVLVVPWRTVAQATSPVQHGSPLKREVENPSPPTATSRQRLATEDQLANLPSFTNKHQAHLVQVEVPHCAYSTEHKHKKNAGRRNTKTNLPETSERQLTIH